MNTTLKVRILLLLLTIAFGGTAITVNNFYNREEILLLEGTAIEKNLHKKEAEIASFLSDSAFFKSLKDINQNEELAQKLILDFGEKKQLYIYTYSNNELSFWGSNAIVPKTDAGISEGSSLITWDNGWYEAFKKSSDGFSVLCLIPIKDNFPLKNHYLENKFSKDLISTNNLEIATFKDSEVYNLRNNEGKYLLSLKLSPTFHKYFSTIEFFLWILTAITGTILMTILCQWVANKGWVKVSILLLAFFFFLIRYLDLSTQFSATRFYGGVFDPTNYASSLASPSLGALFLNILSATWLICYVYSYRFKLQFRRKSLSRLESALIFISFGILIYLFSLAIVEVFRGLITNSSINFDVTNILKLNVYSWIGIVSLCFAILNLYLIIETLFIVGLRLRLSRHVKLTLFVGMVIVLFIGQLFLGMLSISFFLLAFIIYLRIDLVNEKREFRLAVYVAVLLLFATISSLKQGVFQEEKQQAQQLMSLQKLESADDPNAVLLFMDIEQKINQDPELIDFINDPGTLDFQLINEDFRKTYFGGYLTRYDFNGYLFDGQGNSKDSLALKKLDYFKNKVIEGSRKVSDNFYRLNDKVGYLNYFALLPIREDGQNVGLYLIELNNKALRKHSFFPEVLVEGNMEISNEFEKYSYAFYYGGRLQNQNGKFLYPPTDTAFSKELMQYHTQKDNNGFTHLSYRPNKNEMIILSNKDQSWWIQLASLSFLFLVLLVFSIFVYAFQWLFRVLRDYDFNFRNLRWSIMISQNRILYSTRIQAFVVFAVVFTLVIAGVITYFNLSIQYRKQQEEAAISQVTQVGSALEARMFKQGRVSRTALNEQEFNLVAETNTADLNLYGINGELIYSTQPKIYDLGLTSRYINAEAWINLDSYRRDEYFQREHIGGLDYLVSYAVLKNDDKETIAYLSLPFFSNQKELESQVGLLLNTLINIYAFVIVALGLFAAFVANQITSPLSLVQSSLARTAIGRKNEPIFWKRNDEIGSLIREYNNMIIALDHSASQIMQAERESAWREMAKQVAHEIKNPLTPLRLGVQLLTRSWKENDPDFDRKFERFSKSFIEQIESLNHIASEFSNFAKMPDTVLGDVDIIEVIEQAVSIHSENKNITIQLEAIEPHSIVVHADRDQLLRSFNNLLKNAIEARVKGRTFSIVIQVKILASGNVGITIQDNGKGIDENVRERIFQPNFTTKSSGTGLGLALVKQTVETIGGKIRFQTEAMVGTSFFISIPVKEIKKDHI